MQTAPGSFRDPSGQVFEQDGRVLRTIHEIYRPHWEKAQPFLAKLAREGQLVPFEEVAPAPGAWKTIEVRRLPFISFPYEWSYDQLKDAALLTLSLQKRALSRGLVLKDASAYNIQFVGKRPIFLDHLSFELWEEGTPWKAYRQFCSHFIAPLALMASTDLRSGLLSRLWMDGVPLDLAASMLPWKRRLNPGLNFHLFLHARMQGRYAEPAQGKADTTSKRITADYLKGLVDSLTRLIESRALRLPPVSTEWGDYYGSTNYTAEAADRKYEIVQEMAARHGGGRLALDIGANTGRYTRALAAHFGHVLAADIDPLAVDRHYTFLKGTEDYGNILPLVIDFANPSPAIGFNNEERPSFTGRCRADCVVALAVVHHLRITAGIPLALIARCFAGLLDDRGTLVLEFVPKDDSQTQRLLASREDIFADYTLDGCLKAFGGHFDCEATQPIDGTRRTMLLLRKR